MNISGLDQINSLTQSDKKPTPEQLKNAAVQFEAVLLMQLTSAMNGSNNDDEDSLFGAEAGSGLAKQLFSEQMATVMAQNHGVGISDMILRQLSGSKAPESGGVRSLSDVVSSVKGLKENSKAPAAIVSRKGRSGDELPAASMRENPTFAGDPNDVAIISTAEQDLRDNGIEESQANLILDGRIVSSARARLVPNAPIIEANAFPSAVSPASTFERAVSYQKPAAGRISSGFGSRFHPIDKRTKFHGGLDIAVPLGTTVAAAAEGTVVFAGQKGGYGNLVVIRHPDGHETRYGHLSSISVAVGDPVSQGQPIARSGSTGKSTGPHLHFEIRENGVAVDPTRFLSNVLSGSAER